jgi:arginase
MANMNIQIISAPSVLGLRSKGVERLAEIFLSLGLKEKLKAELPLIEVPLLNHKRSSVRDPQTHCLNGESIVEFSRSLIPVIGTVTGKKHFALVLGGDCSILLGIMPALKARHSTGLIFIDAHADFYEPEKSTTGEVADMDLAIVTGRGSELLTDIDHLKPYVPDEYVIHIAQRDQEEAERFGSQDIRKTKIACFSLQLIRDLGVKQVTEDVLQHIAKLKAEQFWIHFDTDVLADEINPAVDYRIPGGLQPDEVTYLISKFLSTGKIAGISVTIYNADLDMEGRIAERIVDCLSKAFNQ